MLLAVKQLSDLCFALSYEILNQQVGKCLFHVKKAAYLCMYRIFVQKVNRQLKAGRLRGTILKESVKKLLLYVKMSVTHDDK